METLEAMIGNNNEKEMQQWMEKHRAAAAIYDAPIEKIENRIVILERGKEAYCDGQKERRTEGDWKKNEES